MVGIYGNSANEILLKEMVEDCFSGTQAACFGDANILAEQYLAGAIEIILLHSKYLMQEIKHKCQELSALNIKREHIYITPINAINQYHYNKILPAREAVFVPIGDFVQIHGLNVHVADHCNLRCKACSHSASLVEAPVFPSTEQYRQDLTRLHEICENICSIVLLGGEPLLNPQLPEFIRISKEIYPYSGVIIITNGILLPQMGSELIREIKNSHVKVSVSVYPMMRHKAANYELFMKKEGINYEMVFLGQFMKRLVKEPYFNGEKMAERCPECVALRNGSLNRCAMSMYIDYYNQYFHADYPEHENINLYQKDLSGKQLMKMLDSPLQLCSYCALGYQTEFVDCGQITGQAQEKDFVIK